MDALFSTRLAAIPEAQIRALGIPRGRLLSCRNPQEVAKLLRSVHNERAPIHQLPDKALAAVFSYVLDDPFENHCVIGDLSLICERWKRAIDHTPHLWASFLFVDEDMALRHAEKSGKLPLHIVVYETVTGRPDSEFADAVDKMRRLHIFLPRLSSLEIFVDSWKLTTPIYAEIRKSCVPALASISVTDLCIDKGPRTPVDFGTITSIPAAMLQLRSLSLEDVKLNHLHLARAAPYNLRRLELVYTDSTRMVPPPCAVIIQLLSRCAQLELLQLRSDVVPFPNGRSGRVKTICLPHLKTFTFEGVGARALSDILSAIDPTTAPVFTHYDFKLSTADPDVMAWFDDEYLLAFLPPSPLPPARFSFPHHLSHLEMICTAEFGFGYRGRTNGFASNLDFESNIQVVITSTKYSATVLFEAFELCPIDVSQVTTFEVGRWLGAYVEARRMQWSTVLDWMPALTELTAHGEPETIRNLSRDLRPPLGPSEPHCPRLEKLTFVDPLWTSRELTLEFVVSLNMRRNWFADRDMEHSFRAVLDEVDGWTSADDAVVAEYELKDVVSVRVRPEY
ncbi:hypothetical protein FKP32DRAFT_1418501 [Trametes sanguinea]|nr:hypothetical protein FKP32DRAFT_1418501 [Trametes sanguinea]